MRRRTSLSVTLATLFAAALWLGFPPIGAQTHRRPPDGSEHRLRGVCGPGVGGERNARRLQTTDGGKSWTHSLKISPHAPAGIEPAGIEQVAHHR